MGKKNDRFSIELTIDVEKQFLSSEVVYEYHCEESNLSELKLYIHKDIEVEEIFCDKMSSYKIGDEVANWCPFVLESKLVELRFEDPVLKDELIQISFKYKGNIDIVTQYQMNRLTKDWVELGMYTPWYPLNEKFKPALFDVKIRIDEGYEVLNAKKLKDYYHLSQSVPNVDCTIIASNNFQRFQGNVEDISFNVYYINQEHKDQAQLISSHITTILKSFARFGTVSINELSVAILPRINGGGYCRPTLMVLTPSSNNSNDNSKNEMNYFKFIAHELGHLWWCKALTITWEDWLNESFAEYSALIVVREIYGEKAFSELINTYKEKAKDLPPIKGIDRADNKAHPVLYIKGPIVLFELEELIGRERFGELLNKVYSSNIKTTETFLDLLSKHTNEEAKLVVHNLLMQ